MQLCGGQRRREDGHNDTDVQREGEGGEDGPKRGESIRLRKFDGVVDSGTPARGPL